MQRPDFNNTCTEQMQMMITNLINDAAKGATKAKEAMHTRIIMYTRITMCSAECSATDREPCIEVVRRTGGILLLR